VAVPGMSALGAHLAENLDVQRNQTVREIERDGAGWRVRDAEGADLGTFDIVLTCIPAPQAIALLGEAAPEIAAHAATAVMHPTWATMVVLQDRLDVACDGAFLNDHASLGWISRDASKPSRSAQDTWVLHANREWSTSHLEDDAEHVALELTSAFTALCNVSSPVVHARAHRWRFALPDPVTDSPALFDGRLGLGAGGDWCGGPRIEGALLSGSALAGRVLCHIHLTMTDPATHPTDLFS
jgi:renalase